MYHCRGDYYDRRGERHDRSCWYHDRYGWYRARCYRHYHHDDYGGGYYRDRHDRDDAHASGGYDSHREHDR
jgi:hypothetical protein